MRLNGNMNKCKNLNFDEIHIYLKIINYIT